MKALIRIQSDTRDFLVLKNGPYGKYLSVSHPSYNK